MSKRVDLTGKIFGRLTVIKMLPSKGVGRKKFAVVLAKCQCGIIKEYASGNLTRGRTFSCGCLNSDLISERAKTINIKHGESVNNKVSSEYSAWIGIKKRCLNKNCKRYKDYGGRGITVCERWLNSFNYFLEDMGRKPSPEYSLDRYPNNDGNYEPSNCRWGTDEQQSNNKRSNVRFDIDGTFYSVKELSAKFGINPFTIKTRIRKGMSVLDSVSLPLKRKGK